MLLRNKSSKISNFSDLPSKTASEAVSAFVIGSRLGDRKVCGATRILDVEGRSLTCSVETRHVVVSVSLWVDL